MGKCIYVADSLGPGRGGPIVREMRSETWMNPAEAGRVLAEDHLLNTTAGVWFYESDLWDKRALRRRLTALARHVTSPEFLPEYEEWGRKMLEAQRSERPKAGFPSKVPRASLANMARMKECNLRRKRIGIGRALELRSRDGERAFDCLYCGQRVIAHAGGADGEEHFEHARANDACPRPR
jgi:hypothetical protein